MSFVHIYYSFPLILILNVVLCCRHIDGGSTSGSVATWRCQSFAVPILCYSILHLLAAGKSFRARFCFLFVDIILLRHLYPKRTHSHFVKTFSTIVRHWVGGGVRLCCLTSPLCCHLAFDCSAQICKLLTLSRQTIKNYYFDPCYVYVSTNWYSWHYTFVAMCLMCTMDLIAIIILHQINFISCEYRKCARYSLVTWRWRYCVRYEIPMENPFRIPTPIYFFRTRTPHFALFRRIS